MAAKKLAEKLSSLEEREKIIILGIPRGGIVVAKELSMILKVPLDVMVTKKIPAPSYPELAVGAIGTVGEPVIDEKLAQRMGANEKYLNEQIAQLRRTVLEREKKFRGERNPLDLKGKIVILADDGIATGATVMAAIEVVRQSNPEKIVIATPVVAKDTLAKIESLADEVFYLQAPALFFAVGQFYKNFEQVSDDEVKQLLK